MISTTHAMSCNDCGKTFKYESKNRAGIAEAATKEGWLWKGAEEQYCSKCKTSHVKVAAPKAKKVAKGKAVKAKKVVKKASARKGPKVHEYGAPTSDPAPEGE
jgi:hypothetical protein